MATKAAFGWDALYGTPYTAQLVEAVVPTADPRRGWPEGIYEVDGTTNASITANTNALVLAALAFKAAGPLLRGAPVQVGAVDIGRDHQQVGGELLGQQR